MCSAERLFRQVFQPDFWTWGTEWPAEAGPTEPHPAGQEKPGQGLPALQWSQEAVREHTHGHMHRHATENTHTNVNIHQNINCKIVHRVALEQGWGAFIKGHFYYYSIPLYIPHITSNVMAETASASLYKSQLWKELLSVVGCPASRTWVEGGCCRKIIWVVVLHPRINKILNTQNLLKSCLAYCFHHANHTPWTQLSTHELC